MSKWMKAGLWVLAGAVLFGAAYVVGRKFLPSNESVKTDQNVLEKKDETGQVVRGRVAKYDTVSLTVATEGGGEMNFPDLAGVSVWEIKDSGNGARPQKTDWSKVAVGQRVSLSMDELGQKLISVIIL